MAAFKKTEKTCEKLYACTERKHECEKEEMAVLFFHHNMNELLSTDLNVTDTI